MLRLDDKTNRAAVQTGTVLHQSNKVSLERRPPHLLRP